MLHIPPTNLLLLAAKQEPYKKAYLLAKNIEEFSGKSSEEWTSRQNTKDRKSNRTRQKNKRGDSKVESNNSPEIPDRGETSDIPGLPWGVFAIECSTIHSPPALCVCVCVEISSRTQIPLFRPESVHSGSAS